MSGVDVWYQVQAQKPIHISAAGQSHHALMFQHSLHPHRTDPRFCLCIQVASLPQLCIVVFIRFAVPIIMLAQMFKGQPPQERSLLRRELSLSNYSSCCCWTSPLLWLSDCCCLILKSTDSAPDMGLAFWKSKAHCKVWQLMVSEMCAAAQPWSQQAVPTPNPLRESWEL